MVVGLERFKEHFAAFTDRYVLIGGAACFINMDAAGLPFRATKDLDIVLCIEALDDEFVQAFWQFVRDGAYEIQQNSEGEQQFYRFQKPGTDGYPVMLELFSRELDQLAIADDIHLTPIPAGEDISSLSAILMDDDYYTFLQSGKKNIDGIEVAGAEHLIPLKARAWLELTKRKAKDDKSVDSKHIKKHKLDVFRLMAIADPDFKGDLPQQVKDDIDAFINGMEDENIDMKNVGLKGQKKEDILAEIARIYLDKEG